MVVLGMFSPTELLEGWLEQFLNAHHDQAGDELQKLENLRPSQASKLFGTQETNSERPQSMDELSERQSLCSKCLHTLHATIITQEEHPLPTLQFLTDLFNAPVGSKPISRDQDQEDVPTSDSWAVLAGFQSTPGWRWWAGSLGVLYETTVAPTISIATAATETLAATEEHVGVENEVLETFDEEHGATFYTNARTRRTSWVRSEVEELAVPVAEQWEPAAAPIAEESAIAAEDEESSDDAAADESEADAAEAVSADDDSFKNALLSEVLETFDEEHGATFYTNARTRRTSWVRSEVEELAVPVAEQWEPAAAPITEEGASGDDGDASADVLPDEPAAEAQSTVVPVRRGSLFG
jgi:hypothetical protein